MPDYTVSERRIMGTAYKETFTKPLPAGATIIVRKGRRLAEWKDAKGKTRTAPLRACESFVVGWAFLPVEMCNRGRLNRMESGRNAQPTMIHGL